ncbi:MAG: TolC family protein [Candidatus Binatus sp.]
MKWMRLLLFVGVVVFLRPALAAARDEANERRNPSPSRPLVQSVKLEANRRISTPNVSVENLNLLDQLPGLPIAGKTTFREYMQRVETSNLDLAAQRFNVPISKGQLLAARIYPDPDFQAGYGGDVSGQRQATTYEGNLSQTILLGGKIGARTEAANATLQASQAQLSDFLRNLRALAANSYIDAVTGLLTLQQQIKALQKAQQLVDLNTRRVEANQTSEDDLIRARINELEERGKVIRYESSLHQTLIAMAALAGDQSDAGLVVPTGRLQIPPRQFSLESLLAEAVSSRSDVIAAARQLDDARAEYQIAKANRVPDLTVGGAYAHETRVTNPIDPAPAWDSLGISLSIPIPLSDLNQGPTEAAYYLQSQAEEELRAAKLRAASEVRSAYERYSLSQALVGQFTDETLRDSDQAYESRFLRLQRNAATLVDVLDTHRAMNQLYFDYFGALNEQAKALVSLERSVGIWDVDF